MVVVVVFAFCLKVLYTRIAIALWRSSQGIERHIAMHSTSTCTSENHGNNQASNSVGGSNRATVKYEKRPVGATESQVNKLNIVFFFFFCCVVIVVAAQSLLTPVSIHRCRIF